MSKKYYVARDANGSGRLIPKGQYGIPWYVLHLRHSKYPSFGFHTFMEYISDEERNKLWDVYEMGGEGALFDAAKYLDETAWLNRYRQVKNGASSRGREWMESV